METDTVNLTATVALDTDGNYSVHVKGDHDLVISAGDDRDLADEIAEIIEYGRTLFAIDGQRLREATSDEIIASAQAEEGLILIDADGTIIDESEVNHQVIGRRPHEVRSVYVDFKLPPKSA